MKWTLTLLGIMLVAGCGGTPVDSWHLDGNSCMSWDCEKEPAESPEVDPGAPGGASVGGAAGASAGGAGGEATD